MDVKIEPSNNPLEIIHSKARNNPWEVEDVSVFLKYHCPECEFHDQNLQFFADHALGNRTHSI